MRHWAGEGACVEGLGDPTREATNVIGYVDCVPCIVGAVTAMHRAQVAGRPTEPHAPSPAPAPAPPASLVVVYAQRVDTGGLGGTPPLVYRWSAEAPWVLLDLPEPPKDAETALVLVWQGARSVVGWARFLFDLETLVGEPLTNVPWGKALDDTVYDRVIEAARRRGLVSAAYRWVGATP